MLKSSNGYRKQTLCSTRYLVNLPRHRSRPSSSSSCSWDKQVFDCKIKHRNRSILLTGILLPVAGMVQPMPLKEVCLRHYRTPMGYFLTDCATWAWSAESRTKIVARGYSPLHSAALIALKGLALIIPGSGWAGLEKSDVLILHYC